MKHFLITISSDICRDGQMIRVFGDYDDKYMKEEDSAILYEAAEETSMGHGDEACQWCDFSGNYALDEIKEWPGTAEELIDNISQSYGIPKCYINVYEVSKKYKGEI